MIDDSAGPRRRNFLKSGLALAGALAVPAAISAAIGGEPRVRGTLRASSFAPATPTSPRVVRPELMKHALTALGRHADAVRHQDRIAIVDFTAPSAQARLHIVDIVNGDSTSYLVAHGSGSDPAHTGWLQRFSNDDGSNASCEGAFIASDYYVGKHGRSQRLVGLDPTNDHALVRAIVVHSAWYSNPEMLRTHGMLGRSQGCFAVGEGDLQTVFDQLGEGRMIYAAKV
ncbi:murein L,D-transpeptidase catalytic domain family protein [Sphingomonas bacterium]|uniref:murein L,D-transpeptidase catalytic domain family protein n=1 Tax=Sphingomonas bacterium TaxID=1895847 RepID=UPI0015752322|nr:murein L,D-transpeptidase catalytic domain family protein [Sphingomonas bacterium]